MSCSELSFQNSMISEVYYNYLNYTDLISFSELWKQSKQEALGWNLTTNMIKW